MNLALLRIWRNLSFKFPRLRNDPSWPCVNLSSKPWCFSFSSKAKLWNVSNSKRTIEEHVSSNWVKLKIWFAFKCYYFAKSNFFFLKYKCNFDSNCFFLKYEQFWFQLFELQITRSCNLLSWISPDLKTNFCKITGTCLEFLEALITDSHGFIPEVLQGGSVIGTVWAHHLSTEIGCTAKWYYFFYHISAKISEAYKQ